MEGQCTGQIGLGLVVVGFKAVRKGGLWGNFSKSNLNYMTGPKKCHCFYSVKPSKSRHHHLAKSFLKKKIIYICHVLMDIETGGGGGDEA